MTASAPIVEPPNPEGLHPALVRNITALEERRRRETAQAGLQQRLADAVTAFAGSMPFVYVHLVVLAVWVATNLGWIPGAPRFDRTFVILATVASVEALFLSTFVLISQNRAGKEAERRAALDLQVNLLAEHEVTRLIAMVSSIAERVGASIDDAPDLEELKRDVAPEAVLDSLDGAAAHGRGSKAD